MNMLRLVIMWCGFATCMVSFTVPVGYVLSRYEQIVQGKHCLFYPARLPKKMVVIFNGAVKNRYSMWSWFWRDSEVWQDTAYLFLRDDDFGWYLGIGTTSFVQTYTDIITHYMQMSGLKRNQVITVGGSMGGYGALLYATTMKLRGAVIYNAQVNYASATMPYRFAVHNAGDHWQDLDKLIEQSKYVPFVSIIFGTLSRDTSAACNLIDVLKKKKASFVVHNTQIPTHVGVGQNITKEFIEKEIQYIERYVPLENNNA